jgi:hypothetical protein
VNSRRLRPGPNIAPRPISACLAAPHDLTLVDHLPALPEFPLFTSYAAWFAALEAWLPRAVTPDRIGVRELKPGVWVGLHTRVAPGAELRAPCWIGEKVYVGSGTVVGPAAILESESFIEAGTEVSHSLIGPKTLVGKFTEVRDSIACGSTLISWKYNSCIKISEPFLLCSMAPAQSEFKPAGVISRLAAAVALVLTLPFALLPALKSKLRGVPVLRPLLAVRPRSAHTAILPGDTLIYYELASVKGWLRRWPQLWHIMRGHFTWVGNRPISPREASRLTNDFERLWLAAPLGLLSLADTEGATHFYSDDTRAHASYYAARASRGLDFVIFLRALFLFVFGFPFSRVRRYSAQLQSLYAAGRGAS